MLPCLVSLPARSLLCPVQDGVVQGASIAVSRSGPKSGQQWALSGLTELCIRLLEVKVEVKGKASGAGLWRTSENNPSDTYANWVPYRYDVVSLYRLSARPFGVVQPTTYSLQARLSTVCGLHLDARCCGRPR